MAIYTDVLKIKHSCGNAHAHDVVGTVHTPASPGKIFWSLEGISGYIEYCPYCGMPLPGTMTWEVKQ